MSEAAATTTLATIPTAPSAEGAATEAPEAEGSAPAEPAAPPAAVEPEEDKNLELAKRFEGLAKREARARRFENEFQTKLSSLSEKEKAIEAKLAELEAALEDPVDYYLRTGKKDPVEVAKRFARPVSEEEKRIKALEDKIAREEEARAKAEAERTKRETEAQRHQSMRQFVGSITPDECPHLTSLYEPHEVPTLVEKLLTKPADPSDPGGPTLLEHFVETNGRKPTDKEIRECLEYDAEIRATRLMSRTRPSDAAAPETPQPSPDPVPAASASKGGPSSISNQHAAPSSSSKSRKKSREELRKELTARLEAESERRGA